MTEKQQKGTNFSSFLKEKRMKLEITLEQLSEGLCSASELARIEAGIRAAGRVLRNSLLYRLGISPDAYENFLFQEDLVYLLLCIQCIKMYPMYKDMINKE